MNTKKDPLLMKNKVPVDPSNAPPEGQAIERGDEVPARPALDPKAEPLPNQPGLMSFAEGMNIFRHKGTTDYPANPGMLDAGDVSGIFDIPCMRMCNLYVGAVPAVGFLCLCSRVGSCPVCCWIAPFNCCGGLGEGGTPIDVFYLPTSKCLPKNCTLAATWFCTPGPCCCYDYHNEDTLLSSWCCCFPQVHRKLVQGKIIV
mmetsp:Transcript_35422/g.51759  ORF Transcript_35422/g.51759 Transcript_35422/m.51759 type:complete len:201 (-) Transcript_35422:573-1175(-)